MGTASTGRANNGSWGGGWDISAPGLQFLPGIVAWKAVDAYICGNDGRPLPGRPLNWKTMKNVEYWLVTTDHLEDRIWFREEEDFKVGMNFVAVLACVLKADILAFILMSNHVHFVLRGSREDALRFINEFKRRYSIYLSNKYGTKEFLRRNSVDLKLISASSEDEALERAIAYVLMNCVAANICSHPSQYPWGAGNLFFNRTRPAGKRLSDIPNRPRIRMLHTECDDLPANWTVGEDGYILPHNYVNVKAVEARFRTPQRLNYFLNASSKARRRIEMGEENLPAFRDQVILTAAPDLLRSLFQKKSFYELSKQERIEFLRQIRYRFSANVNQIARICGLSYADAALLMDNA